MKVQTRAQIWRMPVLLAAVSLQGIFAALFSDGAGDALAWGGLTIPVVVVVGCYLRGRKPKRD